MENVCLEVFVIKDKVIYDVTSFRSVFFYKCEYLSGFNESAPKNFMWLFSFNLYNNPTRVDLGDLYS